MKKLADSENHVHLMNINEDPILTGYIRHVIKDGSNKLGTTV